MITIQSSDAQRLFDHPVQNSTPSATVGTGINCSFTLPQN